MSGQPPGTGRLGKTLLPQIAKCPVGSAGIAAEGGRSTPLGWWHWESVVLLSSLEALGGIVVQSAILVYAVRVRLGEDFRWKPLAYSFSRLALGAIAMGAVCWATLLGFEAIFPERIVIAAAGRSAFGAVAAFRAVKVGLLIAEGVAITAMPTLIKKIKK